MKDKVKVIAFDADDTLWVNEPFYREGEDQFCEMLREFMPPHEVSKELLKTESNNIHTFGYGVKSFVLSMIETAISISGGSISAKNIQRIISIGREQMAKPVDILDGVEEVLQKLNGKYRLVMATKGDLLEQETKLYKSGLENYFHHIEIVSEKKEKNYKKLIYSLDVEPEHFVMIGNSIRSDILPVLALGAYAFHVPFHTTWEYEVVKAKVEHQNFFKLEKITDILNYL